MMFVYFLKLYRFKNYDSDQPYKLLNPVRSRLEYRVNLSASEMKSFKEKALNAIHTLVLFAGIQLPRYN